MQNEDLFYTLYEREFNTKKYLYHYTSFLTAIKIIQGDSLRFSMINGMNDTLEAKPKVIISQENAEYRKLVCNILNDLKKLNIQLLCFSKDGGKNKSSDDENVPELIKYSDYIGRGFALPRMWAQYAQNNSGVCLIFNKSKLEGIIKESLGTHLLLEGSVKYVSRFETYVIDNIDNSEYIKLINCYNDLPKEEKLRVLMNFVKNNVDLIKYNFFSKFFDWSGENEYRFLAWSDENIYIRGIRDALEAVVVGEDMGVPEIEVVKFITNYKYPVMKINFTCDGALLKNIPSEII